MPNFTAAEIVETVSTMSKYLRNNHPCAREGHPSTRKASVEAKCTSVQITSTVPNLTTTSAAPSAGSLQYLDYGHQLKKSFPPLPAALDLSSKVTSASTLGKSKFHDALSEESGLRFGRHTNCTIY